jgi:biopolymer transport protein ExbB
MFPLAILSILTLSLILIYFFALRKGNIVSERFMHTADALIRKEDYLGLLAITNRHNESVARILQRVLEFLTQNSGATHAEARDIAETEGSRQVATLNQQVVFLADIGTLAPMLGLLGTIFGMIKSFGAVAGNEASARAMFLAQGIAEALIATATGLIIGIAAMAAYSFFRGRAQTLTSELEGASAQLLASLAARRSSSVLSQK